MSSRLTCVQQTHVCLAESLINSYSNSNSELLSRHSTNQLPGDTAKTTAQPSTECKELELTEVLEEEKEHPVKVQGGKQRRVTRVDEFSFFL